MAITPNAPANFTPEMGNTSYSGYSGQGSFRFWCQKVLPLVYDDSLSYYETLCKVTAYLNNVISDISSLEGNFEELDTVTKANVDKLLTAYNELQGYVNDYFNTLDVQEEINKKLDEMAEDGTLSKLLEVIFGDYTEQTNSELAAHENRLNVLESRVDRFASLPDGSTSGDAELADIRVAFDGQTYPSAGDSVRGQVKNQTTLLFSQYYNKDNVDWSGHYASGALAPFSTLLPFGNIKIPCQSGDKFYINRNVNDYTISFFDSDGTYISQCLYSSGDNAQPNAITVPENGKISQMSIPVHISQKYSFIISKQPVPYLFEGFSFYTDRIISKIYQPFYLSFKEKLYSEMVILDSQNEMISLRSEPDCAVIKINIKPENVWSAISFETAQASMLVPIGNLLIGYDAENFYGISRKGALFKFNRNSSNFQQLTSDILEESILNDKFICTLCNSKISLRYAYKNEEIFSVDFSDFIPEDIHYSCGIAYLNNQYYENAVFCVYSETSFIPYVNKDIIYPGKQWKGKTWFAYGTSLTSIQQGKYANYLANMSGLLLNNKGIPGGALVANRQIYDALMDNSDGKINADLITIEIGANDATTPIGSPSSSDNTTICGALNTCLKNIFTNCPKAQVIIMPSTRSRYKLNNPSELLPLDETRVGGGTYEERDEAIRKVAVANGAYFIPFGSGLGLGLYREQASNLYNVDNVHHTDLGGYNLACGIWEYLKNIPNWYNELPL